MTSKILVASLAAAVLGTGASVLPANAQTTAAPVALLSWSETHPDGGAYPNSLNPPYARGLLHIAFVNNGTVPATSVTFAAHAGRSEQTFVEQGTFSPGTEITKVIDRDDAPSAVEIEAVTFADGTTWHV
ncbi:MAG: hypothetical protein ABR975_05830 [Vulcanimicrobiaceae bacterium]|jgi:hypothetical protein